jgi:hypothetical protein
MFSKKIMYPAGNLVKYCIISAIPETPPLKSLA